MKKSDIRMQYGFTMLELLISLGILSTLVVFSNQSIQNALRSKVKLQEKLDNYSIVRDALRVIERDVNMAYHYTDIETEFKNIVKKQTSQMPAGQAGAAQNPTAQQGIQALSSAVTSWTAPDSERKDPTTQFVGAAEEVSFITMGGARMQENEVQADFIKIGYALSNCKRPGAVDSSKCLFRRASSLAEGDVTKGGASTLLIDNITEFKLRYIGKGKQDWVSDWNSKTGDASIKNKFPEAVEISLTMTKGEGEKKKKISMQIIAGVHFPNNQIDKPGVP